MDKIWNIGLVGAGMWGTVHLESLAQEQRARVTWVCSRSESSVAPAQTRFGIPNGSTDYREMLADPALEAVIISTPPYLHASQLAAALQAGKHVLLEKPMATTRHGVEQILHAVDQHPDRLVLEASCRNSRLQPKFRFVKEMIDSGKLGRVYHIHHMHLLRTTFVEYNRRGEWGVNKELAGGGPFIDWGVYDLSFHLGLLDDRPALKDLRSFTINGLHDVSSLAQVADVEQHGAAFMEFEPDLTYYYERGSGVHLETDCVSQIYGTRGGLRLHFPSWESNTVEFFSGIENPQTEQLEVDMSDHPGDNPALIAHFLDCLEGRAQPVMPVSLAARYLEILFQILDLGDS
jgi:predicted dehydrogenase